jgi:hypothetical protein
MAQVSVQLRKILCLAVSKFHEYDMNTKPNLKERS